MDEIDQLNELEQSMLEMRLQSVRQKVHGREGQLGEEFCEDCGCEIPMGRRRAVPTATRCVDCQEKTEKGL